MKGLEVIAILDISMLSIKSSYAPFGCMSNYSFNRLPSFKSGTIKSDIFLYFLLPLINP